MKRKGNDKMRYYAKMTGFSLLVMAVLAMFSNITIMNNLVVLNDATKTVNNITNHEMLFRVGILSFIGVLILDVLVSWTLYVLLKSVNHHLSILAMSFRLVYTAIFGIALTNFLSIVSIKDYVANEQIPNQTMFLIEQFNNEWLIGLVFFAFHLLIVGLLIIKSESYLPKIIGYFLIAAFIGYLMDSVAHFILINYEDYKVIFLIIVAASGIIGEVSLALWFLIKGVNMKIKTTC